MCFVTGARVASGLIGTVTKKRSLLRTQSWSVCFIFLIGEMVIKSLLPMELNCLLAVDARPASVQIIILESLSAKSSIIRCSKGFKDGCSFLLPAQRL